MKRFEEQIKNQARAVRLRANEKRDLRERVVSYMEYHPLPQSKSAAAQSRTAAPLPTESYWTIPFRSVYVKSFLGVTATLVLVIVPVMAERAVPGDMLYSIKVGFNEEVRSTIARSPYQEIEWETERLNRRLAEAQLLAREGRLTEEQETRVAEAVRSHSEAARESIERLRADNADEAALAEITLSALFDVHSAVLSAHSATTSTSTQRRNRIAEAIASSRSYSEDGEGEDRRPSYQGLLARIEVETSRAYQLFAQTAESASEEEMENMSRRLDDVERKVQQGIAAYENGEEMQARTLLAEALTTTRKVITFMSNLDVRNSVALDLLVPIEYTAEEMQALLEEHTTTLNARYDYAVSVLDAAEDIEPGVAEKAAAVLDRIPEQFASSSAALAEEDYDTARDYLQSIQDALDDVALLINITQYPAPDVTPATTTATGTATSSDAIDTQTGTSTNGESEEEENGDDITATSSATSSPEDALSEGEEGEDAADTE